MRVLVTGSSSMLGSAVTKQLIERGDDVRVLQRRPSGLPCAEVLGSIANRDLVDQAVEGCDAVVHLAAKVGITGTWAEFSSVNIDGTRNLIEASRRGGVHRFVHISTPSVAHTGEPLVGAGVEPADPEHTRGHYARSKAEAELLALDAARHGLPIIALRPHLVWGPGDTQLIGRIIERAHQGRLAIIGSGAALVDTTFIDNAADAILAGLDRAPELAGRAFVVSNGEPRTVREILERITLATGAPAPTRAVPRQAALLGGSLLERIWDRQGRTDDPPMTTFVAEQLSTAHWFDQRETRAALQWEPKVSLAEGFRHLAAATG